MNAVVGPDRFRVLLAGLHHPEDIVWDDMREVVYSGSDRGEIIRGHLDGLWEKIVDCGENAFVLGMALDARGDLYVCERGNARLLKVDVDNLSVVELSRGTADRPMACPNYPAFDKSGRLFVSDSGAWGDDSGVIFTVDPKNGTEVWATAPSDFTNGLALAPDARWLYVAESRASNVWRIAINPDGKAGEHELVWHVPETVPDGLAFDQEGSLYISCHTPDSIFVLKPDGSSEVFAHDWSGQVLQGPTNVAFVGPDLSSLAHANLCGYHVGVTDDVPAAGHRIERPEVVAWGS